jgi:hypothetical protein
MSRRRYLSGRETELKLGVEGWTGNKVALEVTEGRVGFGTTTAYHQLTVNGDMQLQNALYGYDGKSGVNGQSLISTGSSIFWGQPEITFGGITVQEEGVTVGSAGSVQTVNFVGSSIEATAFGAIATVTVDPFQPAGNNTEVQFNDNGVFAGASGLVFGKLLNRVAVGKTTLQSETLYVHGNIGVQSEMNVEKVFVSDKSPTAANELASKEYVDLFATAALAVQEAVSAASTVDLSAVYVNGPTAGVNNVELGIGASLYSSSNGVLVIDQFNPVIDDRVLIKHQSTEYQNGFYVVKDVGSVSTPWILERAQDFDQPSEIVEGAFTFVTDGVSNAATGFVLTDINPAFDDGGYVGFSTLRFTQFSAAGQVEAGLGLYKEGSTINVGTASSDRIVVNEDDIDLAVISPSDTSLATGDYAFITDVATDGYGRVTGITSNTHRLGNYNQTGILRVDFNAFSVNTSTGIITAADYFNVRNINLPFEDDSQAGIITARVLKGVSIDSNNDITSMRHGNFTGIVTATEFIGSGANLTDIITGVGIATAGGYVGSGATTLDFRGPGVGAVSINVGTKVATITIEGGTDVNDIGSANQVLYKDNNNVATTSANLQFNGTNLTCAGTVTANSDERLKKNVKTIDDALEKVKKLRGVEYDHKNTGDHCLGVIAQEVEKVVPDVVYEDVHGVKSVAYQNMVALLIEALKDQQRQIDELKRQLG